ncbi:MAG: glycosyltransferase, partial [Bacteroidales bacterium]|nr:glycosyltransferase [Bacteroidales bacterium]
MPVKDSLDTARDAISAVLSAPGIDLTVYNDFSTDENTALLKRMAVEQGFRLVNWADHTDHPSPNYLLTLQDAQARAIAEDAHLVIVESDVTVKPETIDRLVEQVNNGVGMVAAVTVDNDGNIN